jgi:hypothetical protein
MQTKRGAGTHILLATLNMKKLLLIIAAIVFMGCEDDYISEEERVLNSELVGVWQKIPSENPSLANIVIFTKDFVYGTYQTANDYKNNSPSWICAYRVYSGGLTMFHSGGISSDYKYSIDANVLTFDGIKYLKI